MPIFKNTIILPEEYKNMYFNYININTYIGYYFNIFSYLLCSIYIIWVFTFIGNFNFFINQNNLNIFCLFYSIYKMYTAFKFNQMNYYFNVIMEVLLLTITLVDLLSYNFIDTIPFMISIFNCTSYFVYINYTLILIMLSDMKSFSYFMKAYDDNCYYIKWKKSNKNRVHFDLIDEFVSEYA